MRALSKRVGAWCSDDVTKKVRRFLVEVFGESPDFVFGAFPNYLFSAVHQSGENIIQNSALLPGHPEDGRSGPPPRTACTVTISSAHPGPAVGPKEPKIGQKPWVGFIIYAP